MLTETQAISRASDQFAEWTSLAPEVTGAWSSELTVAVAIVPKNEPDWSGLGVILVDRNSGVCDVVASSTDPATVIANMAPVSI